MFGIAAAVFLFSGGLESGSASAQALNYASQPQNLSMFDYRVSAPAASTEDQLYESKDFNADEDATVPERLQRKIVSFDSREAPGTIIIDTRNTYLYYVLGQSRAIRYGVGVGRDGFTWSGIQSVSRKAAWPDWHPPAEMISRQPYLPRFMAGGPGNPLGAAAMYLGSSTYRIHGTNDPSTIGKFVSSGCIRLTNADVQDLASRVNVGAKVVVLPKNNAERFESNEARVQRVKPVTTSALSSTSRT